MVEEKKIPEGYKKTEIGVIPDDWKVEKFSELADSNVKWSITGGPFGSNLKSSDYTLSGVRVIQLQNIGEGHFVDNYKIFTSIEKANELLSCNIYSNEIILSKMGDPVARACFVPKQKQRFVMCSDGIRLVVDEKKYSKFFVHEYINSVYFRKRAINASIGSTRMRISLPVLKSLLVLRPSLKEQQAIASALSDIDDLILSFEKLINKKKLIKQGTMQELLTGNKRLKGFCDEWKYMKLKDITYMSSGGTPNTNIHDYYNGNIPWVVIADITQSGKYISKTEKCISKLGIINSSAKLFEKGTLLFAMYASIGKCAIATMNLSCNQAILGINPLKINNEFLYYCLSYREKKFSTLGQTGTQSNLNKDIVGEIIVPFPNQEEQTVIAQILSDMDKEIEKLQIMLDKYKNIKKGMREELLTGKRRLI